ncbi:GFA family protein [Parvularcula sp. IMCC14364]|uniref:GFA family protein n=1 Tax=Parvularcula sp. IMCC14364 TaxID=3067902 RepID=UPI0027407629|nr:GFA family protein [Parvularcula sp. IMCC14364]
MATGACNCGLVAFEVSEEVTDVYVCHCSICRRSTGADGIAVVLVPNTAFRWIRGENMIATWRKPNAQWQTWFCRTCGARVPGTNDEGRMFVPAGAISQGGEGLRVVHHLHVGSKAPWQVIGDAGKQHMEGFEG